MSNKAAFSKVGLIVLSLFCLASFILFENKSKAEDNSVGTFLIANLSGAPIGSATPRGSARYFSDAQGNRSLSVNISNVNLPAGTQLTVFLGNVNIGQITLNPMKNGYLFLQGNSTPTVSTGNTISIKSGSTVILSGNFTALPTPSPSPSVSPFPTPSNALFAPLSGNPIGGVVPRGMGQYLSFSNGRRILKVFVRQINLPANTNLTVFVAGNSVGQITLRQTRDGSLTLDTANGNTVPNITEGSNIQVRNGSDVVLSGTFRSPQTPSPTPSPRPVRFFAGRLDGSQVVPPVTTQARGAVFVSLNESENRIQLSLFFANLSTDATGASINGPAILGQNAPVIFNIAGVSGTTGHVSATFDVTADQVQQLRTGLWYVLVKTTSNPNGEIRGQIRNITRPSAFNGAINQDIAVFRPSNGTWYIRDINGLTELDFGRSGDRLVTGDYDGDGKTDIAVYRDGVWQIRLSSDGSQLNFQWGLSTDIPVRGDFDGDGRSDLAVFRPSNGTWYIRNSLSGEFVAYQFGTAGDIPVAADLDGDGKSDISVFRPSDGTWYWLRSSDSSFAAIQFGVNGDIPLVADFDGDGIDDIAVFRPSNGTWYWLRSSDSSFAALQFGIDADIPVPADFDGDMITDIAVFRPSDGAWYILRSSDNTLDVQFFGTQGDTPVVLR